MPAMKNLCPGRLRNRLASVAGSALLVAAILGAGRLSAGFREVAPAATTDLYAQASPAVVGIRAWAGAEPKGDSMAFGTGTIIDPEGIVLTSTTVAPEQSQSYRVQLRGGEQVEARRILSVPALELVLLKLRRNEQARGRFPFLRLGDSSGTRVGQAAFAFGNAFASIDEDHQVSFSAGALSGMYTLTEARDESRYLGPALETTAAVNDGMDGGPLVDRSGRVIGLLSLNFSRSRWLGTAIPIDLLKPHLSDDLGLFSDRWERFPAHIGLEIQSAGLLEASSGAVDARVEPSDPVVTWVETDGPSDRAGMAVGDRIRLWNGEPLQGKPDFRARFRPLGPGSRLKLGIERGTARREIEVILWGKF